MEERFGLATVVALWGCILSQWSTQQEVGAQVTMDQQAESYIQLMVEGIGLHNGRGITVTSGERMHKA
jgi:hypothetical protein